MRWPWSRAPSDAPPPPRGAKASGGRTICCFLDDSPAAEKAWRWAAANLIDPKRDRVHLVAVATPPVFAGDNIPGSDPELDISVAAEDLSSAGRTLADASAARYAAQLERFKAEAPALIGLPSSRVEAHVLRGDVCGLAGPLAVDYAAHHACDVAVVGSRGLGAFKRGILSAVGLGSVSTQLVHGLHCPTVVVKDGGDAAVCEGPAVHGTKASQSQ